MEEWRENIRKRQEEEKEDRELDKDKERNNKKYNLMLLRLFHKSQSP